MPAKHQLRRKHDVVCVSSTLVLLLLQLLHQWQPTGMLIYAYQSPASRIVPGLAGGPLQYRSSTARFLGSASWPSTKTTTTAIQSSQTDGLPHPTSNSLHGNSTSESHFETVSGTTAATKSVLSSKRELLRFAIPALGIYLANPLLSNIDNAFVGRTVGTAGLAALSPATICTDQSLYLFSFLGRATTGIVARAFALPNDAASAVDATTLHNDNAPAARKAASARTSDCGSCD
jgi:hypothetical protein